MRENEVCACGWGALSNGRSKGLVVGKNMV